MTITLRISGNGGRGLAQSLSDDLSPAAIGRQVAMVARVGLADADARNAQALGYAPSHDTYVNNSRSTDSQLDQVRVGGSILFEFKPTAEVLEFIDALLILHAPVRSGRFAKSFLIFIDGAEVDIDHLPAGREALFINSQPYSRKLERGLSPQAPDGVFEGVATLAQQRFGNVAKIRFSYQSLPGGAVGDWARTDSAQALARRVRGGREKTHHDWLTRQPAIIVTLD